MRNNFPVDSRTSQSLCGPPAGIAPAPNACQSLDCPSGATPPIVFIQDGGPQTTLLGVPPLLFEPLCEGAPVEVTVSGGVLPANVTIGACVGSPDQVCAVYSGVGAGAPFNGNVLVSNGAGSPCSYAVQISISP